MKLDTFIEETITSICSGIEKAKRRLNTENTIIAPAYVEGKLVASTKFIDFEVLVSIDEENQIQVMRKVSGHIGIQALAKIKGFSKSKDANSDKKTRSHKISFSVPYVPDGIGYKKKMRKT